MTHPELKATFQLEILGVKKNPNGQAYTGLGVVTKGESRCEVHVLCYLSAGSVLFGGIQVGAGPW